MTDLFPNRTSESALINIISVKGFGREPTVLSFGLLVDVTLAPIINALLYNESGISKYILSSARWMVAKPRAVMTFLPSNVFWYLVV